ncbi:DUF262 domain-containing protein [Pseudohoeflea suaedae]|uniref:DUF262 domain-containing protein n=1 Tax=Pseudohoeflea suaedae TaxID=877384 RepID=A0A4R5PIS1_9HYPH|nr:DUF262 domain-containing protein [Pseudohoeflea suaedae]TDH35062.1 DUF262 domain-containing protein [Pseudohoeflea suaedae]
MEARSKTVEQWFSMIEQGQIVLPRFQRHEAWRHAQIIGLFENVFRKPSLPVGVLLVLEIGNDEPFHSRPIVGAPEPKGRPSMHLLDGQQRMTALWRTLSDDYEDLQLFVSLGPSDEEEDASAGVTPPELPRIDREKRWFRKDVRQPVWCDDPGQTFERDLIPIRCLRPGAVGERNLESWLAKVKEAGKDPSPRLGRIYELRQRLSSYVIPFLSLGVETSRETALDVFIKMNTSASPLKDFDIVVAQLEEASGESLHTLVEELIDEVPAASEYGKIEDIILSVAALLDGKPPLKKTYLEKDFGEALGRNWPRIKSGFRRGLSFLRNEAIINEKSLPSDVVVYLICALWADIPEHGFDAEGNARSILRKVLWRSCFTDRYGKTSATRSYADFRTLREILNGEAGDTQCELFDETYYPLPEPGELLLAGWPSRKDRLPRAILAASLRAGGYDFADGAPAHPDNLAKREYHHIYPVDVLGGDRSDDRVNRALNCALISWKTNRRIAARTPREYVEKRAEAASLGEPEVRQRLASHLIPFDELVAGDYDAFLQKRAEIVADHLRQLCDGRMPS